MIPLAILCALSPAAHAAAEAARPALLSLAAGGFDIRRGNTTFVGQIEYHHDALISVYRPIAGLLATGDGSAFIFAGLSFEFPLLRDELTATISVAPGAYIQGSGRDLGSVIEFREGLDLDWRFHDASRLGLAFAHISNAGIGNVNPGAELLMVTYRLPLDRLFGGH